MVAHHRVQYGLDMLASTPITKGRGVCLGSAPAPSAPSDRVPAVRTMPIPSHMSMAPPSEAMTPITRADFRYAPRPKIRASTTISSSKACPLIMRGPALNPRRADSAMVTVSMGPGVKIPERASVKDPPNMAASSSNFPLSSHCFLYRFLAL